MERLSFGSQQRQPKKGSGWVDYMWPKPGEKSPSKKVSYVKGAKMPTGEVVIVGAGIYLN